MGNQLYMDAASFFFFLICILKGFCVGHDVVFDIWIVFNNCLGNLQSF